MNTPLPPRLSPAVRRGSTAAEDPEQAADDLAATLLQPDLSLVLLFLTPGMARPEVAAALTARFPGVPVIGCTTAGEIGPEGYRHGTISGTSFAAPHFRVATRVIDDVHHFSVADGKAMVQDAMAELRTKTPDWQPEKTFAMLLIDGLSACEESVLSALYPEMGAVPLFGGSAGDELEFRRTLLLVDGAFRDNVATFTMVTTDHPFRVFKTEHFISAEEKMVVTEANPVSRIVTEINAEPAAREYARAVGLSVGELAPATFANHPLVVSVSGVPYVRSIQKMNPDESLTFFCAIDQGIVLTLAQGIDIAEDLQAMFERLQAELGPPEVVIGCECILRSFELQQRGQERAVETLMRANNVIGFNTYGEQYHAMHVSQTFTGVAIGRLT